VKGKISPEVYERWNREAGSAELPERLHPKTGGKTKPRVKGKGRQATRSRPKTTRSSR
jgi:hypothetical protein